MVRTIVERFGRQQELQGEAQLGLQRDVALESVKGNLASRRIKETFGSAGGGFIPTGYTSEGVTYQSPIYAAQQKLAEAQASQQAEKIDAAKSGIRVISQMRGLLLVDPQNRSIGNQAAISRSGIPGMFLERENPDQRDLRSLQGAMHNFVALVRTGRQGLEQQIPFVQEQYNLGHTDLPENMITRLDQAEQEMIQNAGLSMDEVEQLREEGLLMEYRRKGLAP